MDDFLDFLGIVLVFFVLAAIVIGAIAGVTQFFERKYCEKVIALMPDETFAYSFWTGCMMKIPDGTYAGAKEYLNELRFGIKVK